MEFCHCRGDVKVRVDQFLAGLEKWVAVFDWLVVVFFGSADEFVDCKEDTFFYALVEKLPILGSELMLKPLFGTSDFFAD